LTVGVGVMIDTCLLLNHRWCWKVKCNSP